MVGEGNLLGVDIITMLVSSRFGSMMVKEGKRKESRKGCEMTILGRGVCIYTLIFRQSVYSHVCMCETRVSGVLKGCV